MNEVDSVKQTALGYSSLQNFSTDNCIETAEILLQSGASIKGDCEVILRASKASVKSTKAPKLVEKLIAAGGDVNCTDERTGATPLINASVEGNPAIVKMLLSKGADPNIKMMDGSTALKIAQEGDDQENRQIANHWRRKIAVDSGPYLRRKDLRRPSHDRVLIDKCSSHICRCSTPLACGLFETY